MKIKSSGYVLLIVSILFLSACSKYKERFGGKGANYENATVTKPLVYPSSEDSLKANNRYSIPSVSILEEDKEQINILPPDYQELKG